MMRAERNIRPLLPFLSSVALGFCGFILAFALTRLVMVGSFQLAGYLAVYIVPMLAFAVFVHAPGREAKASGAKAYTKAVRG